MRRGLGQDTGTRSRTRHGDLRSWYQTLASALIARKQKKCYAAHLCPLSDLFVAPRTLLIATRTLLTASRILLRAHRTLLIAHRILVHIVPYERHLVFH